MKYIYYFIKGILKSIIFFPMLIVALLIELGSGDKIRAMDTLNKFTKL